MQVPAPLRDAGPSMPWSARRRDPRREDPDTRRVIHQIREIIEVRTEIADRPRLLATQIQAPPERDKVMRLDEMLTQYREDREDRPSGGGGA
jgi:hypothetical protein